MNTQSVLILRCPGGFGLGSALISSAAYAGYCVRHGLALAPDMRRLPYYAGDAQAGFFDSFELAAPGLRLVNNLAEIDALALRPDCLKLHRYQVLSYEQEPPAPILDIDGVLNRRLAPWYGARVPQGFTLALKGRLKSRVEARLGSRPWHNAVGLHMRHGNGEILESREDFTTAPDYAIRIHRVGERLIEQARALAGGRPVFVTSDNRDFVAEALARIPNAFTLPRDMPDMPIMEYLRERPEDGLVDTVADMWALASCVDVVCVASAFSEAAALVNPKIKLHVDEELRLGHHEDPAFAVHAAQVHAFYRPDYPPVWRDLAAALGAAGDKDGAAASDAIARDVAAGELSGAQLERPVREVARIGQVIDRLKISLRDGSHEANTARWFIRRLLANGYADLAAELLEAVLPTRPNDGRLWALSALVNEKLDRLPMACDAARRAADLLPELPEARLVLARILKRAGDPDAERELAAAARAFKRKGALPKTSPGRNG